jgi:hypothetical protein
VRVRVPLFFLFFLIFPSDLIALVGSCGLWILPRFFVGLAYLRSSQPRELLSLFVLILESGHPILLWESCVPMYTSFLF